MLLHAHQQVGYTDPSGNIEENDQLCPLPNMNTEFLNVLVAEGSISDEQVTLEKEWKTDALRSTE
jgi:hypothetical protein